MSLRTVSAEVVTRRSGQQRKRVRTDENANDNGSDDPGRAEALGASRNEANREVRDERRDRGISKSASCRHATTLKKLVCSSHSWVCWLRHDRLTATPKLTFGTVPVTEPESATVRA